MGFTMLAIHAASEQLSVFTHEQNIIHLTEIISCSLSMELVEMSGEGDNLRYRAGKHRADGVEGEKGQGRRGGRGGGGEVKRYKAKVDNSPFRTEKKGRKGRKRGTMSGGRRWADGGRARASERASGYCYAATMGIKGLALTALFYAVISV